MTFCLRTSKLTCLKTHCKHIKEMLRSETYENYVPGRP